MTLIRVLQCGLIGLAWAGPVWADPCPGLAHAAQVAAQARIDGVPWATLEAAIAQQDVPPFVRGAIQINALAGYRATGSPAAARAAALARCRAAQAQVAEDLRR